ncbi:MAG: hypothetical protein ACI8ZN_001397, partial [Bacteroidia bacterium]
ENFNPDFGKRIEYFFTVGYSLQTEPLLSKTWSVYPNPSQGLFILESTHLSNQKVTVEVYDAMGKKVMSQTSQSESLIQLNLQGNKPGTYVAFIRDGHTTQTVKLVHL